MKTLIESLGPRRVFPPVACQDAKVSAVLDVAEFHHRQPGKDGTTTTPVSLLAKTKAALEEKEAELRDSKLEGTRLRCALLKKEKNFVKRFFS